MRRGIEIERIYAMPPAALEPYFTKWEKKWNDEGGKDINNPKIPLAFVKEHGSQIFAATEPPVAVIPSAPEQRPKDVEEPEG